MEGKTEVIYLWKRKSCFEAFSMHPLWFMMDMRNSIYHSTVVLIG
jgi:hypothetical protein